jgi:hypothetical protein
METSASWASFHSLIDRDSGFAITRRLPVDDHQKIHSGSAPAPPRYGYWQPYESMLVRTRGRSDKISRSPDLQAVATYNLSFTTAIRIDGVHGYALLHLLWVQSFLPTCKSRLRNQVLVRALVEPQVPREARSCPGRYSTAPARLVGLLVALARPWTTSYCE